MLIAFLRMLVALPIFLCALVPGLIGMLLSGVGECFQAVGVLLIRLSTIVVGDPVCK